MDTQSCKMRTGPLYKVSAFISSFVISCELHVFSQQQACQSNIHVHAWTTSLPSLLIKYIIVYGLIQSRPSHGLWPNSPIIYFTRLNLALTYFHYEFTLACSSVAMCKQCVECSSFFEVITSPFQANLSIIHCRWKLQNLSESPIKKIRRSRETIWSLFNYDNQLNEIITCIWKSLKSTKIMVRMWQICFHVMRKSKYTYHWNV